MALDSRRGRQWQLCHGWRWWKPVVLEDNQRFSKSSLREPG
ncbi:hypothetical protein PCH70_37360 [Pseudomonas cichorii JBC1]|nr:hypothetical protein PCH70_37360 [Pseudomonas cichorii JBC1]